MTEIEKMDDVTLKRDRMRFIKNTLSSSLALVGILFNVFYFVSIYKSDVDTYYYNYLIGISIVYNLIFMLAVFLSSEGVKSYKKNYSYLLAVLGVIQLVRIFILPMGAHTTATIVNGAEVTVMQDGQFFRVVAYLVISSVCLIASALVNFMKCRELAEHLRSLGTQGA